MTERVTTGVSAAGGDVVAPTLEDPFVRGGSEAFGGRLGRHALVGGSWWNAVRVIILLAIASSFLMYAQKLPCRNQPWNGFQYSHACYNDIYPLYGSEGLAAGKVPYFDPHQGSPANVEYPVLIGAAMEIGSRVAHWFPAAQQAARFVDVTWFMMMIAAVVTAIALAYTHRRRPWDAALFAAAPMLVLAGLINWDLLAVAFVALAMLAWSRRYPFVAGLMFGLAIATKFYPLLLFAPLLFVCIRGRQLRPYFRMVGGAVVAWLAVDLPVWIAAPSGFATFYSFNRTRGSDWGSIWYAFDLLFHVNYTTADLNIYEAALTIMALLAVAALTFGAPQRPRVPQVFFLSLALFLVVNKVYSPQYVIWLLPLFALARPRWRAFLVWQAAEILYFLAIWLYLLEQTKPGKALEWQWYVAALGLRDAAVLGMCALVVIDILRPSHDVVRMDGSDDPAGGVLDGAPDLFAPRVPAYAPA